MAFDIRNLLQPVAPGLSGAINPLAFIGAGMASGDMGSQLMRMGQLQQSGIQLAAQQQEMLARSAEAQRQMKAQQAMQAIAPGVAKELYPSSPSVQALLASNPELMADLVKQQHKERLAASQPPAPPKLSDISGIRKEFMKESDQWETVRDSYERLIASEPTGPGDIALLTNYMRMLDPGSTVREGEFATAANAGGVSQQIRNIYNSLVTGERLSPELREQFVSQAGALIEPQREQQVDRETYYTEYAKRLGIKPVDVVPDLLKDYRVGLPPLGSKERPGPQPGDTFELPDGGTAQILSIEKVAN